MFRLLLLIYMN